MDWSLIVSLISLGCCGLFFLYCRSYLDKRTSEERILAEFQEEIEKLIVQIDEATDRDSTLVEDRITKTRKILDEVDKHLALYVRELDRRVPEPVLHEAPAAPPMPVIQPTEKLQPTLLEQVTAMYRAGIDPSLIAIKLRITQTEAEIACALLESTKAGPESQG
ncbi:hypothetical protein FACS1894172_19850 [Spirochaetia bacterium]|nr:hypothetical protein FACS1894164_07040 [Spirochaetia bacterium]GHU36778.1 hypothetical protein FACS1894172_19850 [Spirochaetia bacterium]